MGLNNQGLGFILSAKNLASAIFKKVGGDLSDLEKKGNKSGASLEEVGGQLKSIGGGMMAVGLGAAAGLGVAVGQAATFEKSLAQVRTIISEAEFPTARLEKTTMGLAEQFGLPAFEQAGAIYETISSGINNATDATNLVVTANKLAIGGFTTLAASTDILTTAVNTYADAGLTASDAADILVTAQNFGKTTVDKLAASMGRVAPTAHAMGVSFEELNASVAALTIAGIDTNEAVTGMKSLLSQISKPSKEAGDAAKKLGIDMSAGALQAKGLGGFIQEIGEKAGTTQDMVDLFGGSQEALNAIMALTSNGSQKLKEGIAAMGQRAGITEKAYAGMSKTFEMATKQFMESARNAGISIGQSLAPAIAFVGSVLKRVVGAFNSLPKPVKSAIGVFIAVAAATSVAVGAFLVVAGTIMGLIATGGALVVALKVIAIGMAALAVVALPLIAIGGTLFALWQYNVGGFREKVTNAFNAVRLAISVLGDFLSSGKTSKAAYEELGRISAPLQNFVVQVAMWVGRAKNFFRGIADGFSAGMERVEIHVDRLMGTLRRIGIAFGLTKEGPEEASAAFDKWGRRGDQAGRLIAKAVKYVVIGLGYVATGVEMATAAWEYISPVVQSAGQSFSEINDHLGAMMGSLSPATGGVTALGAAWFLIKSSVMGAVAAIGMVGLAFAGTAKILAATLGVLRPIFTQIMGMVRSTFDFVAAVIMGDWKGAWEAAKDIVFKIAEAIIDVLFSIVEGVAGAIDAMGAVAGKDFGMSAKAAKLRKERKEELNQFFNKGQDEAVAAAVPRTAIPSLDPDAPGNGVGTRHRMPPEAKANPGVEGASALAAALAAHQNDPRRPVPPVNLNSKTVLTVDGKVLAEVVETHRAGTAGRSYVAQGATP